jgi:hypothetical protein
VRLSLEGLVMFVVIGMLLGRDAVIITGVVVLCLAAAAAVRRRVRGRRVSR